jgi:spore coat protein A, manganese oxidase
MNTKLSRRQFLKGAAIAGAALALPLKFGVRESHAFYQTSPGLEKWKTLLRGVGPGQIPVAAADPFKAPVTGVTHYRIDIKQFTDQLHPDLGPTTLWGYNPVLPLGGGVQSQKHLGGIVVVNRGTPLQFTFNNKLPPKHIIAVDATIPGANQAQNRTAVHAHGGFVPWISDGGPFDWWGPNGTHGMSFLNNQVLNPFAKPWQAEYFYPNDQSARLLWYHDHAFGITRVNAYAGIASAYIIRDTPEGNMRNQGLPEFIENSVLSNGKIPIRELPIVIQDKIFVGADIQNNDPTWPGPIGNGSLWYPHSYERNRWKLIGAGSRLPNPSVIAEMFGDTMLVNGTVYPTVQVEARRYRLRILNACNARFLNLQLLVADKSNPDGITIVNGVAQNDPGPNWQVLGNEAGFLAKPVLVPSKIPFSIPVPPDPIPPLGYNGSLITGNAERWDVLVDFSEVPVGSEVILYSDAPAPFPSGDDRNDYYLGNNLNPASTQQAGFGPDTRQIMKFIVDPATSQDSSLDLISPDGTWKVDPGIDPLLAPLDSNGFPVVPLDLTPRRLTLNEAFDVYGRLIQMIGTDKGTPGKFGKAYLDMPSEIVSKGTTEIWEILNLTGDTHPIHFHLVNVQVLSRQPFDAVNYTGGAPNYQGPARPPDATELGWKETVKMNPGEAIKVIMKFDLPAVPFSVPASPRTTGNEYVVHCHILEHEEHDMMRPLIVV